MARASAVPFHFAPAFDSLSAPPGALGLGATDLDPTMHTVRFGLNFKL